MNVDSRLLLLAALKTGDPIEAVIIEAVMVSVSAPMQKQAGPGPCPPSN